MAGPPDLPLNDLADPDLESRSIDQILRARRDREALFGEDMFADPAWDMLLELYAAELRGIRLATSSVCAASAAPMTTALRWIDLLETRGWVARVPDPGDARRVFIQLSGDGLRAMRSWLCSLHNRSGWK